MEQPAPDEVLAAIARTAVTRSFGGLDAATVERTKQAVLDGLGVAVAARDVAGVRELRALALAQGGRGEAQLIGEATRVPAPAAAMVNATMWRALDFDDVNERALVHPGASVIPVALAAAQAADGPVDGEELITAVALGIDLMHRLGYAALDVHVPDGTPRTANTNYSLGILVGAVVAARLWGLDADGVVRAAGIAYSQACGNQQSTMDAALTVRVQQGLSASAALTSARLAQLGVTGPTRPFAGDAGYFQTFWNGVWKPAVVLDGLGERSTVTDLSAKPYPCCKFSHTAIEAASSLHAELAGADVAAVTVELQNREYFTQVCTPLDRKRRPAGVVEAQFSLPYGVAVALRHGPPGVAAFEPAALHDEEVLELAARVQPVLREVDHEVVPGPATVVVELADGTMRRATCEVPSGDPRAPMSWEALADKFRRAVSSGERPLPEALAGTIVGAVETLETVPDLDAFLAATLRW